MIGKEIKKNFLRMVGEKRIVRKCTILNSINVSEEDARELIKWTIKEGYIEGIKWYGRNELPFAEENCRLTMKGVEYLESLEEDKVTKIKIINPEEFAGAMSEAFGIDKIIIEKMLKHQMEIKEIFGELTFISADSLVVAKEHLEKLRKDNSKVQVDGIISVISNLISIASAFK